MRKKFLSYFIFFCLLFPIFLQAEELSSKAQDPAIQSEAHTISGEVMSPFCPGRSLNDCPSSLATDLRNQISEMLASGKSKDQVLEELYGKFGEQIRAMPKTEGFGLVAWLSPFIFVLLGLGVLTLWLSKHKPQTQQPVRNLEISPEMKKRIDDEVFK